MGISSFVLAAIVLSLILTNIKPDIKQKTIEYKNIPVITFSDSTYFEINEKRVEKIITSAQALNYKYRDELYDATIVLRNKFDNTDSISAEFIYNKKDIYKLYQNVNLDLKRDNNITLSSDYVEFDTINSIIKNNKEFDLQYNNNQLLGDNLYFDANKKIIKAHNTHFLLKTKN